MRNMSSLNPVALFGTVPKSSPTYGVIIGSLLAKWEFQFYPQLWTDPQLEKAKGKIWKRTKFSDSLTSINEIPVEAGVYFFTVEGRIDILPFHAYVFYVGKAEKGLRSRYKNYIKEELGEHPEADREYVTRMLVYFKDWLYFNYLVLPPSEVVPMESALKDNLTPPANVILKLKGRIYP
jgi:hypothetical protein